MVLKPQIVILCRLAAGYEVKDLGRRLKYNEKYTFIYEDFVRSNDLQMGLKNGWLKMVNYMRNVPRKLHLVPHRKPAPPPALPAQQVVSTTMTPEQIAQLKQELAAELRAELKSLMPELAASLNSGRANQPVPPQQATPKPEEPMFIPTIETGDMKTNLNVAKHEEQSVDDISNVLSAVKKSKKT